MIVDTASASALASVGCLVAVCMAAGSAVRGNRLWPGTDMLVGFGLVGAGLTILSVATAIRLSTLMIALAVLSIVALAIRRQIPGGRETAIALTLVSPILVHAFSIQAAWWDEFWHWLPSAAYAFNHDSLAKRGLVAPFSHFPGYPQGLPLMIAAASLLAGRFLEAAGPAINVALLAGVSAMLADAIASALTRRGRLAATGMPLFLVAATVIVTILLNPGLDGNIVLSSYADCGTMVALGALGLIGVEMLMRLSGGDTGNAETLAWRFGFVGALLVSFKQANPVLQALVVAGLAVIAWRDPSIAKLRALAQLPRMLGPAIVVFVMWRWYVLENVPHGEVALRTFETWSFAVLPSLLAAIWGHITKAALFHAMMWTVTGVGVAAFFTLPRKASEARWLTVVCATVWLGYNAFLLIIYLGAFTTREAETAVDYWRYAPHVSLLALFPLIVALATGHWPAWKGVRRAALALAAVLLGFCILPLRRDLNSSSDRAWSIFMRDAIAGMRQFVPAGSEVVIVQCWNESPFAVMAKYDMWQLGVPELQIRGTILQDGTDPAIVVSLATRSEATYLIVQDSERAMDEITDEFGLPRIDHEFALFAWRNGAWEKVRSWAIPPSLMNR